MMSILLNYKDSKAGMFPNWKHSFKLLFPFIHNTEENEEVKAKLNQFADDIIAANKLANVTKHIVGFQGTQNYGTVDGTQGVTFKDVAIDQRIIKTIEIDEMDLFKVDVAPILSLELENVARTAVDRVMALVTPTNFATTITVGADTAFDASKVIDLRKEDQVRKYNSAMRKLALNVDYSIALQQDPVINNHNTLRPVDLPSNVILNSFSKFGGGLYESENMTSANNVVGFVTNGNGIAIATPSAYQSNDPSTTFEQTTVSYNGWDFLLRRTKDTNTGAVRFSIELQFGFAVADELGICPLISA